MKNVHSAVISLVVMASTVHAGDPVVSPPRLVAGGGGGVSIMAPTEAHYSETSIKINPLDPQEIMVAAIKTTVSPSGIPKAIDWFVSFNRGQTFPGSGAFTSFSHGVCTGVAGYTVDPTIAVDPETGIMWIGGMALLSQGRGLFLARRLPGYATLDSTPLVVTCTPGECQLDKPLLATGPRPGSAETALYLGWHIGDTWIECESIVCPAQNAQGLFALPRPWITTAASLAPAALGDPSTWLGDSRIHDPVANPPSSPFHATAEYWARWVIPKVLPFDVVGHPPLRGRIVVAMSDVRERDVCQSQLRPWNENQGRPIVVFSEDGGATWSRPPARIGHQASPPILWPATEAFGTLPDLAFQPNDPRNVYVVFNALAAQGATNRNIYIARSTDGGATFPSEDIIHLTNAMLGFLPDANQGLPAIAIDACGGINLLFYTDAHALGTTQGDAYYARLHGAQLFTQRLTTASFMPAGTGHGMGDYVQIDAVGTSVYPAYVAREFLNGAWTPQNLYVRQITVDCE